MHWQLIAAQASCCSSVLHLASAAATSDIFLRPPWTKHFLSPFLEFQGDASCSSQVCQGQVTTSCECWATGCEAAPVVGSPCLKHWLAQSFWEASATLVTTNFPKLFVSPCQSFYISIKPLCIWHQFSPVQEFLFWSFYSKNHQAVATRDSLVLPCCSTWARVFLWYVFQHFFGIVFYHSAVNNANWHYMSKIILQFKL